MLRGKLHERAIALDEAVGRTLPFDGVAEALSRGFSRALNLDLEPGALSLHEKVTVDQLRSRYSGDEWTYSK
jgi:hypothetical protein